MPRALGPLSWLYWACYPLFARSVSRSLNALEGATKRPPNATTGKAGENDRPPKAAQSTPSVPDPEADTSRALREVARRRPRGWGASDSACLRHCVGWRGREMGEVTYRERPATVGGPRD